MLTNQQITSAWEMASPSTRDACATTAEEWIQQGPFLLSEITKALSTTRGSVSWKTLATLVSGSGNLEMMSDETIRKFVMALPNSSYKTTKLLPKLDKANKQRRKWWGQQFWIFFESARTFNNCQVVLIHMDKKWFWSIVVRRNLKCIPVLGIEPVQHGVQHKSHLDKTMGIASTGFIPTNNDITKGGVAHLVSLTHVGKNEKAVRNTYKRVYKPDGTYHYPKVQSNVLQKKGQFYFKNLEITGSSTGTTKNPKFCLLDWFKNIEIPACEELCRKVGTTQKTILRYQMDGAGPHQDGKLLEFINDEFQKRGWLLKFQPSNSPVTNVKDDCLFPALSKHISREQRINKGSQIFTPDELWVAVKKCWHNFPLDSLARGYVRHAQMASALVACNGGDDFVRERGRLHYNVRNCCATVCGEDGKPMGVEVLTCYDDSEEEEDDDENNNQKLRYEKPNVEEVVKENLQRMTSSEVYTLFHELPQEHPWFNDVMDAFLALEASMEEDDE